DRRGIPTAGDSGARQASAAIIRTRRPEILRGSGRCERLLLPLFWLCAPAKVGAHGRLRVAAESCYDALDGASGIRWRSLHAPPCTSATFRRQAASRHDLVEHLDGRGLIDDARGWRRKPEPA